MDIDQSKPKVPDYTLKAIKKYQEKNKEKILGNMRSKYAEDPEYRENKRKKALERYYKNKEKNIL